MQKSPEDSTPPENELRNGSRDITKQQPPSPPKKKKPQRGDHHIHIHKLLKRNSHRMRCRSGCPTVRGRQGPELVLEVVIVHAPVLRLLLDRELVLRGALQHLHEPDFDDGHPLLQVVDRARELRVRQLVRVHERLEVERPDGGQVGGDGGERLRAAEGEGARMGRVGRLGDRHRH